LHIRSNESDSKSMNKTVPLGTLLEGEHGRVICYPKYDHEELQRRIAEMRLLGATALCFVGEKTVNNLHVLGKGHVGIVILGCTSSGKVALKVRRTDADRAGMEHEAEMLRKANSVSVGPRLLGSTGNLLAMRYIKGLFLPKWIETLGTKENAARRVRNTLMNLLEQCWRLDEIGLDHGELSRAPKHIVVDGNDRPFLLDFETASTTRRVSNVTSVCQYLFMTGETARLIDRVLGQRSKDRLLFALRAYKRNRRRESFGALLRTCLP